MKNTAIFISQKPTPCKFPIRQRLSVDCTGIDDTLLSDVNKIYNFMENITQKICMRTLIPPIVIKVPVVNACENIYTATD